MCQTYVFKSSPHFTSSFGWLLFCYVMVCLMRNRKLTQVVICFSKQVITQCESKARQTTSSEFTIHI